MSDRQIRALWFLACGLALAALAFYTQQLAFGFGAGYMLGMFAEAS